MTLNILIRVAHKLGQKGRIMVNKFIPATQPTLYFIGVTTGQSSIMRVFPEWAKALGLRDTVIKGFDLPIHAPAEMYREVVDFIHKDPLSYGALVTTHKIDLFNACRDMFSYIDHYADKLHECSCISKRNGQLRVHAKDPISSGLALEDFVPHNFWKDHGGEVLLMGAGGSSLAISLYLTQKKFEDNIPKKIIISNRSLPRLESAAKLLKDIKNTEFEYVLNPEPAGNDATMGKLPPYSLVVNATGLGKDAPGSPLTNACSFPENSLVWELNYRGDLLFMHQAEAQAEEKRLHVEDGWRYFIYGWTQVISEVFDIPIEGEILDRLSKIASEVCKA